MLSDAKRAEFERVMAGEPPKKLAGAIRKLKKQAAEEQPKVATRKASEMALEVDQRRDAGDHRRLRRPHRVEQHADARGWTSSRPENRKGRYVHYGIREHGMAAAMNGIALHGGCAPYGGTFLCFADYARGAMRLSSLMGARAVYVMTHDSIGLGEDGPTHQPVEHLAMLRATPNIYVFRPADVVETAEAWEIALTSPSTPSVLALSRQNLPALRDEALLEKPRRPRRLCPGRGRGQAQRDPDRHRVGGRDRHGGAGEAAGRGHRHAGRLRPLPGAFRGAGRELPQAGSSRPAPCGWRWRRLPPSAGIAGCAESAGPRRSRPSSAWTGFGASAPARELYEHFGITADAVAEKAKSLL